MTAGTSDNQTGGTQPNSHLVRSPANVLRTTCTKLLGSDDVDIPAAADAVYAYASTFTAGIPSMRMRDCPDTACLMCSLSVQDETCRMKRYVEAFIDIIDLRCQQRENSDSPREREVSREIQQWVDACRNAPQSTRYQVLTHPRFTSNENLESNTPT